MDVETAIRDVNLIDSSRWPQKQLGLLSAPREGRFQVVIKQSALDAIHRHGEVDVDVEICGVLVGNAYRDAYGPYLYIEAAVKGTAASSRGTSVTFTSETWTQIQAEMDAKYQDQKMLGWYHTHPGFGIFLSDMDIFIHANFFNLPWQTALVYDPVSKDEGIFLWKNDKPERDSWLVEREKPGGPARLAGHITPETQDWYDLLRRTRILERRVKFLAVILMFLLGFFAAWVYVTAPWADRIKSDSAATQPSTQPSNPPVNKPAIKPTTAPSK